MRIIESHERTIRLGLLDVHKFKLTVYGDGMMEMYENTVGKLIYEYEIYDIVISISMPDVVSVYYSQDHLSRIVLKPYLVWYGSRYPL